MVHETSFAYVAVVIVTCSIMQSVLDGSGEAAKEGGPDGGK